KGENGNQQGTALHDCLRRWLRRGRMIRSCSLSSDQTRPPEDPWIGSSSFSQPAAAVGLASRLPSVALPATCENKAAEVHVGTSRTCHVSNRGAAGPFTGVIAKRMASASGVAEGTRDRMWGPA